MTWHTNKQTNAEHDKSYGNRTWRIIGHARDKSADNFISALPLDVAGI